MVGESGKSHTSPPCHPQKGQIARNVSAIVFLLPKRIPNAAENSIHYLNNCSSPEDLSALQEGRRFHIHADWGGARGRIPGGESGLQCQHAEVGQKAHGVVVGSTRTELGAIMIIQSVCLTSLVLRII